MLSKENILQLLACTETYRVEKTISTTNTDKFCEAICAFSNDMSNSRKKGYLLIGVHDNGSLSGLRVTDELQKKIASIRVDGNILPMPLMTVDYVSFEKGDVLVVEVTPSSLPPVRYKGRTYIRIGPRKDIATLEEERILSERRSANFPTYDSKPCFGATIDDLDIESFLHNYLPKAISNEIIRNDQRSVKEQLASLRLYNLQYDCPTNAAIVLFGKNPLYHMMGNYIQYVHWDGDKNEKDNTMVDSLASLDLVLKMVLKNKRYIVDLQNDNVFEEFLQKNNLVLKETLKISLKNMLSILALINENNQLSLNAMAESIHISYSSLDRLMSILRNGMISRIGPKKGGYWKINWTDTMANDKNNDNNEIDNE